MSGHLSKAIDLNAFSEKMRVESDRACAALGSALLEQKLKQLFERRLRNSQAKLLGGFGPIATFSARIRLAHALAWISDAVAEDLDVVRDIRNDLVHSVDHTRSFEDQSIRDRCRNLRCSQAYLDGHDAAAKRSNQNLSP